jgi:hypothetical protein
VQRAAVEIPPELARDVRDDVRELVGAGLSGVDGAFPAHAGPQKNRAIGLSLCLAARSMKRGV